ncbi:N-acetyltransferase family 8 member 3 [Megalops cyprinoides]|uniref:N-acetyltransferase family 8 member 3 n=1 Tax=Megalops cyprinoides TaxID=118141 RepID=UPI001863F3BB|nr:N-acetyltransferase family 8 member 3 [Megalops cyprinoides]
MPPKSNLQCEIRHYKPMDKAAVISLFRFGIMEHIYPAFFKAMSHPDHVGVTLSISMAGYVLGGSSYFMALLAGGAWAGLVYYCCHEIYDSYIQERLRTDMSNIQAHFLEDPDSCFWVAEAEIHGRPKVVGMVAVVGKRDRDEEEKERGDVMNGDIDQDGGDGSYAEIIRMIVSFPCRRKGVGSQLAETALDFCKERGFSRVVLETSSAQTAAIDLYHKLGFTHTLTHTNTHAHRWVTKLARITVLRMEKVL